MASVSAEALLVSALLNNQAVGEERSYGITEAFFEGYADEYNWLGSYLITYGSQPTCEIFKHQFPNFPLMEHADIRSAADMVHRGMNRRRLTEAISDAVDLLHLDDTGAAYAALMAAEPRRAAAQPRAILTDTGHLAEWDQRPYSIELPYPSLQRHTGGIRAGNLWYIAARPGQGKSAHLVSIAVQAVLDGNRVLFYSLEMSEEEVRARFHACMASKLGYPSLTLTNIRNRNVERATYRKFHEELAERLEAAYGVPWTCTPRPTALSAPLWWLHGPASTT